MTRHQDTDDYDIDRRTILKSAAAASAMGLVGIPALSGNAVASGHITETIYLTNSVPLDDGQETYLYSVELDSSAGVANLTELFVTSDPDFQRVDAIAGAQDGTSVVFVDRDSSHLGVYDVDDDSFTDEGQVTDLPSLTVLAAFGLDGTLYVASNTTNKLYTIDRSGSTPVANEVGTISGATVDGADIVFDSTGTLFLHSNYDDTLYTVNYQNPDGNGNIAATVVGTAEGSSLTGLAVRDAGAGNLVGSSRADDAIFVLDKTDGQRTNTYTMLLDGETELDYLNGDMATGVLIDETCDQCTSEGLLAKYEFDDCTDYDEDLEDCVCDFVLEGEGDSGISYTEGSFTPNEGDCEPITATFDTDYCDLYAVVKSGQEFEVQAFNDIEGTVTVERANDEKYAISFVAFFCTEDAATEFAENFPSRGRGGGRPN